MELMEEVTGKLEEMAKMVLVELMAIMELKVS